jgi:SAM-dependent methyltransferase
MNFQAYSRYYDLLYQDTDTAAETDYVESLLRRFDCAGKRLLEIGCGSGRHGKHLANRGWQWRGVERSKGMVHEARAKGLHVTHGCLENTTFAAQSFDATLALFHVISYLTKNEQLETAFTNTARSLSEGGLFVFDVWYSPAVYHQKPEPRTKEVEDAKTYLIRKATPKIDWNQNLVDVVYDITIRDKQTDRTTTFSERHPMRHFSLPELQSLAHRHNFHWLHAEEWMTGRRPGTETWGVCCVLRKQQPEHKSS